VLQIIRIPRTFFRLLYFVLIINDEIPTGIAKPTGGDAPEGFTKNCVTVFKGYFCKYVCQKSWDNFYEEEVLLNEELRTSARAIFNERTEEEFHNARYDNNADYARLARYVLDCLVLQGLLTKEEQQRRDSTYLRTPKLNEICPQIVKFALPVIQPMVEEYDRRRQQP
jgi:hypothetical protein